MNNEIKRTREGKE